MLNDLKALIAVPSVLGTPREGAPFGDGPREALSTFLRIASGYGCRTHDEHGYCGWAEIGEGKDMLGILGHLDVVPAGEGWSHDPFTLTVEDGLLYGRGVTDDKGPTVAALHAMVSLLRDGTPLRHRIRLIVGCNEENGSECIDYYRKHCEIPKASFVPDADFPIINSEKGILHLQLRLPADDAFTDSISAFHAGVRPNIVPDNAVVSIKRGSPLYEKLLSYGRDNSIFVHPQVATVLADANLRIEDFSAHLFEDRLDVEARGVAGHAMAPEQGENAAYKLFLLLAGLTSSSVLALLRQRLCSPNPADKLGIAAADDVSGNLTVNLGIADYADGALYLTLDCRLPVCANHEAVEKKITAAFEGCTPKVLRYSPNLYIPQDSALVRALLSAYTEATGEKGACLYCGGGTYARELPNAVAFGPTFPGIETNIHNIDESFPLPLFTRLPEIYRAAILKLDSAF